MSAIVHEQAAHAGVARVGGIAQARQLGERGLAEVAPDLQGASRFRIHVVLLQVTIDRLPVHRALALGDVQALRFAKGGQRRELGLRLDLAVRDQAQLVAQHRAVSVGRGGHGVDQFEVDAHAATVHRIRRCEDRHLIRRQIRQCAAERRLREHVVFAVARQAFEVLGCVAPARIDLVDRGLRRLAHL